LPENQIPERCDRSVLETIIARELDVLLGKLTTF